MSALQFLRERAGVLVAGVIGLSLFIFVVSDFFGKGRSQRIRQRKYYEIGLIDGEAITYQDYEQRVQSLQEIYKLSGTSNLDEKTSESIREQTWQQMIKENILDSKFKDLGIGVSNEELNELVFGNDPHPVVRQLFTDRQTGQFNKSFLVQFLKNTETDETAKKYWLFFENEIVSDRMSSKYNNLVVHGLYVTSKQAEFESKINSRTVDFSYTMKNYSALPDSSVTVSADEIRNYYNSHKESYKRSVSRDIEYVAFDINPSDDDYKQAEQWINKAKSDFAASDNPVQFINSTSDTRYSGLYTSLSGVPDTLKKFIKAENRSGIFGPWLENGSYKLARLIDASDRPDSVHARHILIAPKANFTLKQAAEKADSLMLILKKGVPFGLLAQSASDDKQSAQTGGDLGWFKEGQMTGPLNNYCFSSKKGDMKIVETTYGVHIIEILDISKKIRKYDVGIIDRKVIASSMTNQKVYAEASRFAGNSSSLDKFIKEVAEEKLNMRVANNITPQQKNLPGLDKPRPIIMALFQSQPGKIVLDQNQQAVFEIGDKYVIGYCTKAIEEGTAPLTDVENDMRYSVIKDKKADKISGQLRTIAEKEKTIESLASAIGSQVQEATQINFRSYSVTGAGIEPSLIATATTAEKGVLAGPVKGNNGVFMITVNNISATSSGDDMKLSKERLSSTFRLRGTYEAYEALRKSANIIDKRYKFY
jgi:peptidyl-prolyl cis-trans isomerase D